MRLAAASRSEKETNMHASSFAESYDGAMLKCGTRRPPYLNRRKQRERRIIEVPPI
jgi:hypothetical protein